jgi:hypothetical protein
MINEMNEWARLGGLLLLGRSRGGVSGRGGGKAQPGEALNIAFGAVDGAIGVGDEGVGAGGDGAEGAVDDGLAGGVVKDDTAGFKLVGGGLRIGV